MIDEVILKEKNKNDDHKPFVYVCRKGILKNTTEGWCDGCNEKTIKLFRLIPCSHYYCVPCTREKLLNKRCSKCNKIIESPVMEILFRKHYIMRSKSVRIKTPSKYNMNRKNELN